MNPSLKQFLEKASLQGGFNNDDVVAIFVPLFKTIALFHEEANVAPDSFINQISIQNDVLHLAANNFIKPKANTLFLTELKQSVFSSKYNTYLLGFKSHEIENQHHDAVSDIFLLGLLLASFAMNIDIGESEGLEIFTHFQTNPSAYNGSIHPIISSLITNMTALSREERAQDLNEIIERLENYREFNLELQQDLSGIVQNTPQRHETLLLKLRSRLFDLTRRNRMLYYKPSSKLLNLTFASIPVVLNLKYIRPNSLMLWSNDLENSVRKQKTISLKQFIHFEDYPYIFPSLNKIRLESNRDIKEFGFSELKLAGVFLNWFNFKENPDEAISSPLFFIPVKLIRRKGISDNYNLEISSTVAEINPVLQFQLKELYNINLPDEIDFENENVHDLYNNLKQQIEAQQNHIDLEFIDEADVDLIYSKAQKSLSKFYPNKSNLSNLNLKFYYSNKIEFYLNSKDYKEHVKKQACKLEYFKRVYNKSNKTATVIKTNKHIWQFDLCQLVLGNFNYKKMTLVRDYNEILNQGIESDLFNALFKNEIKKTEEHKDNTYAISNLYNVVESDPSQDLAIISARENKSYLIQGPPGTGKSQTITNLIADFVARGKKVLFVCEKRAALDVVYQRLEQNKLGDLCCLIHDSQADKKEFVHDLKKNYENNIHQALDYQLLEKERNVLKENIDKELQSIDKFHQHMLQNGIACETSVRELLNKIIALKNYIPPGINQQNFESLPNYNNWEKYGHKITQLYEILAQQNYNDSLSEHHINLYNDIALKSNIPLGELQGKLNNILNLAEECEESLSMLYFNKEMQNNLQSIYISALDLKELFYFSKYNLSDLLNAESVQFKTLLEEQKISENANYDFDKAVIKNKNWLKKLSLQDCENALIIAQAQEGQFFAFLNSDYRALKTTIQKAYNFEAHQIKPTYTQVLLLLIEEYKKAKSLKVLQNELKEKYPEVEINTLIKNCKEWHHKTKNASLLWFIKNKHNQAIIKDAEAFTEQVFKLNNEAKIIDWKLRGNFLSLQKNVNSLIINLHDYAYFLPYLLELYKEDNNAVKLLRNEKWKAKEIEAALVFKSLQSYLSQHRDLMQITSETIQFHTGKLKNYLENFRQCNALYIKAKQNLNFTEIIRLSELSVAGLNEQERKEKASFLEGRKILEHEFSKSMRYKSIRDLASDESGNIVRELKPIWLMSPLSVSDTLPIKTNFFDVVIYDEASQITLEEGIPPLFRAPQTIIVGDKMQMPPSNFFNKKSESDEDDEELIMEQVDSLLDQGSRKLPSVMLQWHYRSRHESLIGYSNAAFYGNSLLTIPDVYDLKQEFEAIEIRHKTDAAFKYKEIFKRPISYHYIKNGLYERRTNENEAEYIAELVKHLLLSHSKLSIGIVAFSKEQQNEIENALYQVQYFEKAYEELFDDKVKRVKDYEDIFIKNLENVQGDERDIIIMSTCYGYNKNNKMLMNFGPINRKGGEKRLNVIFSRAKKHMIVVSSIKHTDITNEYNEGANYFKKYLNFAEEMSLGKVENGLRILKSLHWQNNAEKDKINPLAKEIASAVNALGFYAENNLGQSDFKCHVAIKIKKENKHFDLGIIIDDAEHYKNEHLHASYLLKPLILEVFGWKTMSVFAKDWYENKHSIIRKIENFLKGENLLETKKNELTETSKSFEEDNYLKKQNKYNFTRLETTESYLKFWEVAMDKQDLIIQYGRLGKSGHRLIKTYSSPAEAINERRKLIELKLRVGYVRV